MRTFETEIFRSEDGEPPTKRKATKAAALLEVGAWLKREFPPAYTREALLAQHEKMVWLHDLLHGPKSMEIE